VRILYILTSLGIGGAEKQVVALAERMAAEGHVIAILVLKHTDEEWPVKLPVMRLNMRKTPLGIGRGLRFARDFLVLFRPDILHSHTFPANLFTRLLVPMLRSTPLRPRVINTIHNVHEGGWHRMILYRATDPLADRITAVSAAAADRFTRLRAVPAGKMTVLTNGIDAEQFAPDRGRRKRMRAENSIGTAFLWLAVGRLVPAKDYPNLLRAFAQVHNSNPASRLWIAGEGDAAHFTGEATQAVEFLGLRHDIPDLLDAADGFVLSSAWEGMPLAVGEAMAMEKLVLATDVGGVKELVDDAGLIVPPNDSDALAEAMLKAMGMPEMERKTMQRDARRRIQMHYSMPVKAEEWEQFYRETLAGQQA
jgi:glycosyltransferase involved in cell wall biosynthesis